MQLSYARGAAIFCANTSFQKFLAHKSGLVVSAPDSAAIALRRLCQIKSRRELCTDPVAADKYTTLIKEFNAWAAAGRVTR